METPASQEFNYYQFNNPRQLKIYDLIERLVGNGMAGFYRDACRVIDSNPAFETTSNLVFHLLREVEGALRDILNEIVDDDIEIVVCPVCEKPSRPSHKAEIIKILKVLNIKESSQIAQTWLKFTKEGLHKYAHRSGLERSRPFEKEVKNKFEDFQNLLHEILNELESQYIKIDNKLNALAKKKTPKQDDLKRFLSNYPNNQAVYDRFFNALESSEWLPLIIKSKILELPPDKMELGDGYFRYPQWMVLNFLKKIAAKNPQKVSDAIKKIPQTNNLLIEAQILEVIVELPLKYKKELKNQIISIFESEYKFIPKEEYGANLISKLISEKEISLALNLIKLYLKILPVDKKYGAFRDPDTKIDTYRFDKFLQTEFVPLSEKNTKKSMGLLSKLLDEFYNLKFSTRKKKSYDEHSIIGRPNIEKREEFMRNTDDYILDAIIRIINYQIFVEKIPISEILSQFDKYKWMIFLRLKLFVLSKYPKISQEILREYLLDERLLDENSIRNEYDVFLSKEFKNLKIKDKNIICQWIEDAKDYREYYKDYKDVESGVLGWQERKLSLIKDSLNAKWSKKYETIKNKLSEIKQDDNANQELKRPSDEISMEDLRKMSDEELIKFIKTNEPENNSISFFDEERLSRKVSLLIQEDINRFVSIAEQFSELSPIYGDSLISALFTKNIDNTSHNWQALINFFHNVIVKNGTTEEKNKIEKWDRGMIISIVIKALRSNTIPTSSEDQTFEIIETLTNDPRPTIEEEFGTSSNRQPFDVAINSVRSNAIIAIIEFALWKYRDAKSKDKVEVFQNIFSALPKVEQNLDNHLNNDLSPAVHSVFGIYLPQLLLLSKSWTIKNIELIFPKDNFKGPLYKAAWETYLLYSPLYNEPFKFLIPQYIEAINNTTSIENTQISSAQEKLAEHIMIAFLRGLIDIEEPAGLFTLFWNKVDVKLIEYAFGYFGRSDTNMGPEQLTRIKKLWEFCISEIEQRGKTKYKSILPTFAWYFSWEKFDQEWAVNEFNRILKLNNRIEPISISFVIKRLSAISSSFPLDSLRILESILSKDGLKDYFFSSQILNITPILSTCINSTNEQIKAKAIEIVNRLSARGVNYFSDLIK